MSKITPKIHYRIIAKFSFPSLLDYPNPNLLKGKNKKIIKHLKNGILLNVYIYINI